MSRISRLSGAILAQTNGRYFLVGDLKEPCNFANAGFETPGEIEPLVRPYIELKPLNAIAITAPYLEMNVEGEALAALLAKRFLIERNGSVSDRLWRIVTHHQGMDDDSEVSIIQAQWIAEIPSPVWQIVRDSVLKCS